LRRKSQLAIEYSYQVRENSTDTWVFWVHASSVARFEEGYRRIAERTKPPGWDEPKADTLRLVRNWLCDEANGCWIMILDNADDLSVFFNSAKGRQPSEVDGSLQEAEYLADFLPQSQNGSILITSRDRDTALRLTGNYTDVIRVEPMDKLHALALLQKKLDSSPDEEDALKLLQNLDYIPLAITQAAAYIKQRAPWITVSTYLNELSKSDRDRASLLEKDVGDIRRDGRASNSIISTWQISFEHIREVRASAARLTDIPAKRKSRSTTGTSTKLQIS
jgi:hypothetical protein